MTTEDCTSLAGSTNKKGSALTQALHPLQDSLDKLFVEVMELEPPYPHEKADLCMSDTGLLLDNLAVRVARSRGALDLVIGARLDALLVGERLLSLGYAKVVDYAREELGIGGRSALQMAQLARELRTRPILRKAVFSGDVSARKALVVLPVAAGDCEESWTALARQNTVRHLEEAVQQEEACSAKLPTEKTETMISSDREDEAFCHLDFYVPNEDRGKVDEAFSLAKQLLGPKSTKAQCLEIMCQEYLASYPPPDKAEVRIQAKSDEAKLAAQHMRELQSELEELTEHWSFLDSMESVCAPMVELPASALELHGELLHLAALRTSWDELLGRLALLLQMLGLWRHMEFASFGHYCKERLGMSGRAATQRASLERSFWELPGLCLVFW